MAGNRATGDKHQVLDANNISEESPDIRRRLAVAAGGEEEAAPQSGWPSPTSQGDGAMHACAEAQDMTLQHAAGREWAIPTEREAGADGILRGKRDVSCFFRRTALA